MENTFDYVVFAPDQVLTDTDLNNRFDYLDEQTRFTRNKLIGIGIVCGLEIVHMPGNSSIKISKGCGVTSQGFLTSIDDSYYRFYMPYTAPAKPESVLKNEGIIPYFNGYKLNKPVYELLDDTSYNNFDSDTQSTAHILPFSSSSFFNDYVIVLFLEASENDLKNCDIFDCNNNGSQLIFTTRALLVSTADITTLSGVGDSTKNQAMNIPHEIYFKRFNVPNANLQTSNDIINAFAKLVDDFTLQRIANAYIYSFEKYKLLLNETFNPFNDLFTQLKAQRDAILANNKLFIQYFYDFVNDLVQAYYEFTVKISGVAAMCCPDEDAFPMHLALGIAAINTDQFLSNAYRQNFIYSPLFGRNNSDVSESVFLYERMRLLPQKFTIFTQSVFNNAGIKVTPSQYEHLWLSQRAIPYYYRLTDSGSELYKYWSYYRTTHGNSTFNLGYNSNLFTSNDVVVNPLAYDIEFYNFFRIEGHIGKNYVSVLNNLVSQVQSYNLPFDVVAVQAGGDESGITASQPQCSFQDLDSLFNILRSDLYCLLGKLTCYAAAQTYTSPYVVFTPPPFIFGTQDFNFNADSIKNSGVEITADASDKVASNPNINITDAAKEMASNKANIDLNANAENTGMQKEMLSEKINFMSASAGDTKNSTIETNKQSISESSAFANAAATGIFSSGAATGISSGASNTGITGSSSGAATGITGVSSGKDFATLNTNLYNFFIFFKGTFLKQQSCYNNLATNSVGKFYTAHVPSGNYVNATFDVANLSNNFFTVVDLVEEIVNVLYFATLSSLDVDGLTGKMTALQNYLLQFNNVLLQYEAKKDQSNYFTAFEEHINLFNEVINNCFAEKFTSAKNEITVKITRVKQQMLFANYYKQHQGMEHKSGVPKGGTFVIVYNAPAAKSANSTQAPSGSFVATNINRFAAAAPQITMSSQQMHLTDDDITQRLKMSFSDVIAQNPDFINRAVTSLSTNATAGATAAVPTVPPIADNIVIADFYIPYICCSDCPPVAYIFSKPEEEDTTIFDIQPNRFLFDDAHNYPFTTNQNIKPADFDNTSNPHNLNLVTEDDKLELHPAMDADTTFSTTLTYNNKTINITIVKPDASFTINVQSSPSGEPMVSLAAVNIDATNYEWRVNEKDDIFQKVAKPAAVPFGVLPNTTAANTFTFELTITYVINDVTSADTKQATITGDLLRKSLDKGPIQPTYDKAGDSKPAVNAGTKISSTPDITNTGALKDTKLNIDPAVSVKTAGETKNVVKENTAAIKAISAEKITAEKNVTGIISNEEKKTPPENFSKADKTIKATEVPKAKTTSRTVTEKTVKAAAEKKISTPKKRGSK